MATPSRFHAHTVRGRVALLSLLLLAWMADAAACQRLSSAEQVLDDNRSAPNLDLPDYRYGGVGGFLDKAYRCPPGPVSFQVDVALAGLTYVRDIRVESATFAAYRFSDRSMLVGFQHQVKGSTASAATALHVGQVIRSSAGTLTATADLDVGIVIMYFLPGGAMESVPYHHLGTIETWPESDPSQRLRHPVSLGFSVPTLTCSLVQRDVTLAPASAERLQYPDDTAGDTAFDVMMACPSANIDVTLSMGDANDPASTGSVLVPAAGADAGGVRVQLLRGGQPMQFGQRWSYGYSSKGDQPLTFSARYLRVAEPLAPGVVKGEAVLTADYR